MIPIGDGNDLFSLLTTSLAIIETDMIPIGDGNRKRRDIVIFLHILRQT